MVVNRDDVDAVSAQRFQDGRHLAFEHRHIPGNHRVVVGPGKRGPRVQPHARIDRRPVLAEVNVGSPHRDLVDRTALLAYVPDDLRKRGAIQRCRRSG